MLRIVPFLLALGWVVSPWGSQGSAALPWLAAALLLESRSAPLPGFGAFSAAPALLLAGRAGLPAVLVLACARWAMSRRSGRDLAQQALPLAIASAPGLPLWGGLLVWLSAGALLGFALSAGLSRLERDAWRRDQAGLAPWWLALGLLAWLLGQAPGLSWGLAVPLLWVLQSACREHLSLRANRAELRQLEELTRRLSGAASLEQCFDLGLQCLRSTRDFPTVAFFGPDRRRLAACGPLPAELPALVLDAFVRGEPGQADSPARLALPLAGRGVLYLSREGPVPTAEEHAFLASLQQRLVLALVQLEQRQAREQKVEVLEQEVGLLGFLLEAARKFSSTLRSEALMQELIALLQRSFPERGGEIWLDPSGPSQRWGAAGAEDAAWVRGAVQSGSPQRREGLVCLPILAESNPQGALVLRERSERPFSPQDVQVLWALAFHLGSALNNARLFQDVVQARQELERSQVQLVESSKRNAIADLAAGVAHEINSPLGAILGTLEMVEMQLGAEQDKARQRISRARQAGQQAQRIVAKLLTYSRHDSERLEEVELHPLLEDTLAFFGKAWTNKNVTVENQVAPGLRGLGRAGELQQVLVNLLNNAVDACADQGQERRRVRITGGESSQGCWLAVEDRGSGIEPALAERIFEPFFTTKKAGSGTGLGLAISRDLVGGMGGQLELESRVGEGSRFVIRLRQEGKPA